MEKILIIQTAFLGDLILTTPLLHEIRIKYPDHKIDIIVNSGTEGVLDSSTDVDKIIPFNKKKVKHSILGFYQFLKKIRKENYAICFSPHFSYRSSIISFFSGAKMRIGYEKSGFSFLHTVRIKRPLRGMHEVDKLYSLIYPENEFPLHKRPYLKIDLSKIEKIKALFTKNKIVSGKYIVVAPSSVWETKRMPEEQFIRLIHLIENKIKLPVILIGSPGDRVLCERIAADCKKTKVFNFAGDSNLIELSWIIKNAKGIVTNDSSPIHFASAHNVPTLAIFGATVADFGYTPLADKKYISEVKELQCRPCGIHGGNYCPEKHFKCMKEQNLDVMLSELKKLIQ